MLIELQNEKKLVHINFLDPVHDKDQEDTQKASGLLGTTLNRLG